MKKIISFIILISFLLCNTTAVMAESLPDLPNLPDFDSVMPPEGIDAFSPSAAPPQVAPKQPVQTQTEPSKSSVAAPVKKTIEPQQKSQPVSRPMAQPKSQPKAQQKTVKKTVQTKTPSAKTVNTTDNSYYKNNLKTALVVPEGKKFKVHLSQSISSSTPEGTRISFRSYYPETSRYITIPAGTVFYGKIVDSHGPQITGNGGLIVIKVNQMVYKGRAYEIDAKVSVANGKHIFLNNIKGKRMYFQSIPRAMKPGTTFFKKMWRVTCRLAQNESGVEIILTPFSLISGVLVYAVNFVASPVLAIFYKGKSITIPANSQFTIQLREDAVLLR